MAGRRQHNDFLKQVKLVWRSVKPAVVGQEQRAPTDENINLFDELVLSTTVFQYCNLL